MNEAVFIMFAVSLGIALTVFHRSFSDYCLKDQTQRWGFSFTRWQAQATQVVVLCVGIASLTLGLLCLLGVVRVK